MNGGAFNPFAGGEILRVSPTTLPQKEILTSARISDIANTAFNEGIVLTIAQPVDILLLEKCLGIIKSRHDILNATFTPSGNEMCQMSFTGFTLSVVDLSSETLDAAYQETDKLLRNIAVSPMNLEEGPLMFAWAYIMPNAEVKLIIAVHHIVCDGWSFGLLIDQLQKLYNESADESKLPEANSYLDYAEETAASEAVNRDIDYWLAKYAEAPDPLDLPIDFTRPSIRTFEAARIDYKIAEEIVKSLPSFAAMQKASVVNVALAAYVILLHRLTGAYDIVVGLPLAGQAAMGKYKLFGHMVQLLPIRVSIGNDATFGAVVGAVKREVLDASEHPNFTYGKLIEKIPSDRSRVPLVNTLFNIDQPVGKVHFGESTASVASIPRAAENFEIFFNFVPSADQMTVEATYSTALFEEGTIQSWLDAFSNILKECIQNPDISLSDIRLADSMPQLLVDINRTERPVAHQDVISAFQKHVLESGESIAVISDGKTFTYAEMDKRAASLAATMRENGVKQGDIVGICIGRTESLVVTILAIMKLGGAYLPLDPEFPEDRLHYMISDSGASVIIVDEKTPAKLRELGISMLDAGGWETNNEHAAGTYSGPTDVDSRAYMIYTSGSTGRPKGVSISHRAMINFIESMAREPGITKDDRLLAITTLSFDISVLELFLPLCVGASVVIAGSNENRDGTKLNQLIARHNVTVMQATPGTWRMLRASGWEGTAGERTSRFKALVGGEPLPGDLVRDLLPHVSELWNMYGPTETTVWSTCKRIERLNDRITIGRPVGNTQVYVLDERMNILPVSVPGELAIGGEGLASEYHNKPDLTESKFISHPEYGRLYLTGDIVKLLPSGELLHQGRSDDQVKIRGFRIELGEIESALLECEGVAGAAVYLWKASAEDVRIVACCVSRDDRDLDSVSIRRHLRSVIPSYMIPQYFLRVDAIPTTPNGKVNRRMLPKPEAGSTIGLESSELVTDTEKAIADIWRELLITSRAIGREDNFFEVGGHSLLALEFIRRLESGFGVRLSAGDVVTKNLQMLAQKVSKAHRGIQGEQSVPVALPQTAVRHPTFDQLEMIRQQDADKHITYWNLPAAWKLHGDIDKEAILAAINRLVERQTALRTVVVSNAGEYALQLLNSAESSVVKIMDYTDRAEPLSAALDETARLSGKPFDLGKEPLARICLFILDEKTLLLGLIPHQFVFDGWSFDIFLKELEEQYVAIAEKRTSKNQPLSLQYRDYCEWHSSKPIDDKIVTFHKQAISVAESSSLPEGFSSGRGVVRRSTKTIELQQLSELESIAAENNWRLHEILLAVFAVTVNQQCGLSDIVLSLPVTGRYIPEAIGLIGGFTSSLPAAFHVEAGRMKNRISDLIRQLREFYAHEQISLGQLLSEQNLDGAQLRENVPYSFSYQDIRKRPAHFGSLALQQIDIAREQLELPIEAWVRVEHDCIKVNVDYDEHRVESTIAISLLETMTTTLIQLPESLADSVAVPGRDNEDGKSGGFWRKLFG